MPTGSPDITRNYHGDNPESVAANPGRQRKESLRKMIETMILAAGQHGCTADEVEAATLLPHQTASARVTELKARNLIHKVRTRPTRLGRNAAVYVHVRNLDMGK
jgi:hypothetical protein